MRHRPLPAPNTFAGHLHRCFKGHNFITHSTYRKSALLAGGILIILAATAPAHAQIVYDNGAPGGNKAYSSDPQDGDYEADTFTFTAPTTVNTVLWWGVYFPNTTTAIDNFTLSFYNTDSSGTPNATPFQTFVAGTAVNRTPTNYVSSNVPVYQYTATLSTALSLGSGVYGLGIVNDPNAGSSVWGWSLSNLTGDAYARPSQTANHDHFINGDHAFNLQGTVNAAAGMFGATLLFGMVKARRKSIGKKAAATA